MAQRYFYIRYPDGSKKAIRIRKDDSPEIKAKAGKTFNSVGKQLSPFFQTLLEAARELAKKGEETTAVNMAQTVLDAWVSAQDKKGKFGYNDYLGAVRNGYRAEVWLNGKRYKKTFQVGASATEWGEPVVKEVNLHQGGTWDTLKMRKNVRRLVYMLKKERHPVRRKWSRTPFVNQFTSEFVRVGTKEDGTIISSNAVSKTHWGVGKNGKKIRIGFQGRLLNAKGRRLGWKKDWVDANGRKRKGTSLFSYVKGKRVYRFENGGAKRTAGFQYNTSTKGKNGRPRQIYDYYKKARGETTKRTTIIPKRRAFIPVRPMNRMGRTGWQSFKTSKSSGYSGYRNKSAIIIYNCAPFAGQLEKNGYTVMPKSENIRSGIYGDVFRYSMKDLGKGMVKELKAILS